MGYLNEDDLLTIQCIVLGIADAKSTGVDHQNISMKTLEEIAGVIQKQQDAIKVLEADRETLSRDVSYHNCNTCGRVCEYRPCPGERVRANCFRWIQDKNTDGGAT